jgi:Ca-activated chloride channel family protein
MGTLPLRITWLLLLPVLPCSQALAFQLDDQPGPSFGAPAMPHMLRDMPRADLRVDVPLVLVPVHVITPLGASVTTLKQENFRLFEDNVAQTIRAFVKEDAPVSVGLLFDTSGSMRTKIRKAVDAAAEFFKSSNPEDEFFLVEFNERPKLTVPFTQDSADVYERLARARPSGRTSLYDALSLALAEMKSAHNLRKAIVIVSDGGDNHSHHTEKQILSALREVDVQIYALGIFEPEDAKLTPEERNGPEVLEELAGETGGRNFTVDKLDDLQSVCAQIGRELRTQYLLGYSPLNAVRDGKYRRVKVSLVSTENLPPLKPYYRLGYTAPLN